MLCTGQLRLPMKTCLVWYELSMDLYDVVNFHIT